MEQEWINHPKHYNSHESGIEAIEIIRTMSFNIGSAFKYIYRKDDKENALQDLKKALWYINDEIMFREKIGTKIIENVKDLIFTSEYSKREELVNILQSYEKNKLIASLYWNLHLSDQFYYKTHHLEIVKGLLESLIEECSDIKENENQLNINF